MFQLHPQLEKDTLFLGSMPLSQLLLMNDSSYPWLILVPRIAGATELIDLSTAEQHQFLLESNTVSAMLKQSLQAEKLNVAALGNVVPQLHIHHIARYSNDQAWPKPIWGAFPPRPYNDHERENIIQAISSFSYDMTINWVI